MRTAIVTEIQHERTACYGTCPVYVVVFRRDGSASFSGEAHVSPLGDQEGRIRPTAFERLVRLVEDARFFRLKSQYIEFITCQPTYYTTVTRGSRSKKVETYGRRVPPRLRALEEALEKLRRSVAWKPAAPGDQLPNGPQNGS